MRPSRRQFRGACIRCTPSARDLRSAALQEGGDHLEQLALVDRTAGSSKSTSTWADEESRGPACGCTPGGRTRPTELPTSAKFRSAWIPPAVAQAPIVTRRAGHAPDLRIRSVSCSGGDRPLHDREVVGPRRRRGASGKYAMSTCPASASNSSSQSSSVSWQPSQEANFQTASSSSLCSQLAGPHQRLDALAVITGPSAQMNTGPNWQCPQCADRALMLRSRRRRLDRAATPRSCSATRRSASSPRDRRPSPRGGVEVGAGKQVVTTPTARASPGSAASTVTWTSRSSGPSSVRLVF